MIRKYKSKEWPKLYKRIRWNKMSRDKIKKNQENNKKIAIKNIKTKIGLKK